MKICVVGGGASGMFAAIFAARGGADVVLIEKNEKLGKKLFITGKGRCNVTNDCELNEFFPNIVHGEKFMRSALYGFSSQDAMNFFEEIGLKLVVERGNRVFPFSQKSSDVIKVLEKELLKLKVDIRLETEVHDIKKSENEFWVYTSCDKLQFDKVIIATGGVSYPSTGSTGDGYRFAEQFGHKLIEPKPALAPILVAQKVAPMQGISLKNVTLTAIVDNRVIKSEFGEMMFTTHGITGPIVLTLSSYVNRYDKVKLILDLKPMLDEKTLDKRLLKEFEERKNQDLKNVSRALLPQKLNSFVLAKAKLDANKKVNSVTKEERERLIYAIKNLPFDMTSLSPFSEAIITSGGIDCKSLKPTMESRTIKGLYFVGEAIDIDALTGGYNLQLAYASGVIAGKDACKSIM